jgi:hypothetical protein
LLPTLVAEGPVRIGRNDRRPDHAGLTFQGHGQRSTETVRATQAVYSGTVEVNYGSASLLSTDVFAHRFPSIAVRRSKHGKAASQGVPIAFGREQAGMCHRKLTPLWR